MQTRVLHSAVGYFCIAVFLSPVVVATFIRVVFANLYIAKIKKKIIQGSAADLYLLPLGFAVSFGVRLVDYSGRIIRNILHSTHFCLFCIPDEFQTAHGKWSFKVKVKQYNFPTGE